jgi:hypothetical protein
MPRQEQATPFLKFRCIGAFHNVSPIPVEKETSATASFREQLVLGVQLHACPRRHATSNSGA